MKDLFNCPCFGKTLDKLIQPAILAILSEKPSHGYGIAEKISEIPDFGIVKPDVSGIYRSLKLMESRKLVIASWNTPAEGRAKRLYSLTPSGQACLAHWAETLENHRLQIEALLAIIELGSKTSHGKTSRGPRVTGKAAESQRNGKNIRRK